ncbi:MAG: hypothetical protein AB7T10_04505 [bacterium]
MHKTAAVLILVCFFSVSAEISIEPMVPELSELPAPIEIYYPEYSFTEITASTYNDLSLYFSSLDGLSFIKLFALFNHGSRKFLDVDYRVNSFKFKDSSISFDILLKHASDSSSGTIINPSFKYDNFIGKGLFSLKASSVVFPQKMRINNLSRFSYTLPEESFNWGILSNWQRTDKPLNSHIGFFIEKENIRYGLFYSRNIFPFIHIKPIEKSDFGFEFLVDAERKPLLDEEELFSSMRTRAENQKITSIYFGSLLVNYFSLKAKAKIYSNIDDVYTYNDMSSLYYSLNVSYSGKIDKISYDIGLKTSKTEISQHNSGKFFAFYENKELRVLASYKIYILDKGLSHIISPSFSIGDNSKRITFGVRNILSELDADEDLYAPERTYFISVVYIHASLFGNPKN